MTNTATTPATPADQVKQLQGEADALAKQQAAAATDAKAMQKAFEDAEKEITAYIAEYEKIKTDTKSAKDLLKPILDRIKQHSAAVAQEVDGIIQAYDTDLAAKRAAYATAVAAAATAGTALKNAEEDAETKQGDFEKKKGRRDWLKTQLGNLDKTVKAADAKEDAEAYAEAYTIAKVPYDAAVQPPTVAVFASELRGAWSALYTARQTLRQTRDDYGKAVRTRDDLRATIGELEAKRAEYILKQVIERQANGGEDDGEASSPTGLPE
jgi:chromosome segregation ATPase